MNNNKNTTEPFYSDDNMLNMGKNNDEQNQVMEDEDNKDNKVNQVNGFTPNDNNINLNVEIVTIAKDYNGIQVSFKEQILQDVKYYLHVYRLDKNGKELGGQGSYLLVGLDIKKDKDVSGRLISEPIPIKHPKAEKYIVALQYTYKNTEKIIENSAYEFPDNLANQNKIFTLDQPIEDQVAEYMDFEKYKDKKQEIEEAKLREEATKSRIVSNADGSFNLEQIKKSLGGFPDSLFLDQSSISSLDELIDRNLKLGVLNVNAHISENVYQDPKSSSN
tara:strand:- start:6410 stop:7237 length:828 start_codon:yes stop_codon:yes gene_type:complete